MKLLENIKKSISRSRYNISRHAKNEMSLKEDNISEKELIEAILGGEIAQRFNAADISGDGQVTSLNVPMILQMTEVST